MFLPPKKVALKEIKLKKTKYIVKKKCRLFKSLYFGISAKSSFHYQDGIIVLFQGHVHNVKTAGG